MKSFDSEIIVEKIFCNSIEVQEKIQDYSLERKQMIPKINLPEYERIDLDKYLDPVSWGFYGKQWETLYWIYWGEDTQERYWLYECAKSLYEGANTSCLQRYFI